MPRENRWLIGTLRAIGLLDLFALAAAVAPRGWIESSHVWLGLGEFPSAPIAGYLARCTSLWYASYGALLWFVSCDVRKYSFLIACLASILFTQGLILIVIDIAEGMPTWWIAFEGPCCSGLGALLLILNRSAARQEFAPKGN